jgi:hypothetical protein
MNSLYETASDRAFSGSPISTFREQFNTTPFAPCLKVKDAGCVAY